MLNLHCPPTPSLLCHGSVHAVGAGIVRQVKLLDRGQDICHKQAAAWLQDNDIPYEKGLNIAGKRHVDPDAFRVNGETFMNSTAGGMASMFWWVSLL